MKIRSITYFMNPGWPLDKHAFSVAGAFTSKARTKYQDLGFEVQTIRLASVPFPNLVDSGEVDDLLSMTSEIETAAQEAGFDYVSLGPALPDNLLHYRHIPVLLGASQSVFLSGRMTTDAGEVSQQAVRACAETIFRLATLEPDGFANLRFAALANVPSGVPFFPAAYHHIELASPEPAFAVAVEGADLAVEAVRGADSLAEARDILVEAIESHASRLSEAASSLENDFGVAFGGMDFTPAPFPERDLSFGTAVEELGTSSIGSFGSLAAAAFFADAIDRAEFKRAGFNGLFTPVLEDSVLAERAAEGTLTIKDLLLYSTVCGSGLDTVPLPGDTSVDSLHALLLDVAVLAQRLDKPLTARLMPIPGKSAGDPTEFDFDYFANSRVMALQESTLTGILKNSDRILISKRNINAR